MQFHAPVPILRSFDEGKAREFYIDWLGFEVDWSIASSPARRSTCRCRAAAAYSTSASTTATARPGRAIRIQVDELEAFHAELQTRPYKNYRPGLQDQEWGAREMTVQDGAGNKLIFYRDLPS